MSFAFYLVHELVLLNVCRTSRDWTAGPLTWCWSRRPCLQRCSSTRSWSGRANGRLRALVGRATPGGGPVVVVSPSALPRAALHPSGGAARLDRLTSLRFFAALAVVAYHAVATF